MQQKYYDVLKSLLEEKEIKTLNYIFENKIVGFPQIKREFFPTLSRTSAYRNLSKLRKFGLLKISRHRVKTGEMVSYYHSTPLCFKTIINPTSTIERKNVRLTSIDASHDLALTQVRASLLNKKGVLAYLMPNAIGSGAAYHGHQDLKELQSIRPDGFLKLEDTLGKTAWLPVELEMEPRAVATCRSLIKNYRILNHVPVVLLICSDEKIIERYRKAEKELLGLNKPLLATCLLSDVLSDKEIVNFDFSDGTSISLKNINQNENRGV